ncbi:MAG TPA: carboxypeptidase-like regulatory domain-containing protein, partial [Polyangia bacterium]|nr:carboxypeptidase-like regulatory domain-containing protein [Polyangia bacterium]
KKDPEKKLVLASWSTDACGPDDEVQIQIATEEHPPGTAISIELKTSDGDEHVETINEKTTGDSTNIKWKYNHDAHGGDDHSDRPSDRLPDYYFEATVGGDTKKSGVLSIRTTLKIAVKDKDDRPVRYARFQAKLVGGNTVEGELDENGEYQIDDVPPGSAHIKFPDHKGIDFDS